MYAKLVKLKDSSKINRLFMFYYDILWTFCVTF